MLHLGLIVQAIAAIHRSPSLHMMLVNFNQYHVGITSFARA